jgi:hypothetical protein
MNKIASFRAFEALGVPAQLSVFLLLLKAGPSGRNMDELHSAMSFAPDALTACMKALGRGGLIHGEVRGRYVHYCANFELARYLGGLLSPGNDVGSSSLPLSLLGGGAINPCGDEK